MNPIDQLKSVLCDHEGKCCISGSDEDRAIIDRALRALAEPAAEPVTKINLESGRYLKLEPYHYSLGPMCWRLYTEDDKPVRVLDGYEAAFVDAALNAAPVREPAPEKKGLFVDLIAEHPGLAEELAAMDVPAPVQEPEMHKAMCPALTGGKCNCPTSPVSVDKAWAGFCGGIGRGPDAPYPGMIEAFEAHYAQSFTDRDWRNETGVWAAAWSAAKAQQPAVEPDFWTACGWHQGQLAALPSYSSETKHGVEALVLDAARKEGFGGGIQDRLDELGWEIRPAYLTAPQAQQEKS